MTLAKTLSLAVLSALTLAPALQAATQKSIKVTRLRETSMAQALARQSSSEFASSQAPRQALKPRPKPAVHGKAPSIAHDLAATLVFGGYPVVGPTGGFLGFDGINSTDSATANGFTVEPPDQGMSTNGGEVLETVNLALQAFTYTGKPLSKPVAFSAFFGIPSKNPDGTTNNLSDPRTFYDWQTHRWFITILDYHTDTSGNFSGSDVLVAASATPDVIGGYYAYVVHACDGCLADQPLVGFNDDGVYLSTNDYSATSFTAQIIALNKVDLLNNSSTVTAAGFDGLTVAEGTAFSVAPAFTAPGTTTTQNNGTEFFTSSLDFQNVGDARLAVWALTNTETLESRVPNLNLIQRVIPTEAYVPPVPGIQKAGSYPLGMSLGDPEEAVDTGDDRMLQVYYTNGRLYTTLATSLFDPSGQSGPRAGGAWFDIQASSSFTSISAHVEHQGYIGINSPNASVHYPAFAVNNSGEGVIGFSFTGPNYFPSTGYVLYSHGAVVPQIHLAGVGQAPDDGFSGYSQFGGAGVGRWGDYSAAMVSPGGRLWFASEYIPNPYTRPRNKYTNWGTFISRVY